MDRWRKLRQTVRFFGRRSIIALFLLSSILPVHADTDEYNTTAAMLYNLTLFVTWPEQAFSTANSPLGVCLLGDGAVAGEVQRLSQKWVGGHPLETRELADASQAQHCHLVFIGPSEEPDLPRILAELEAAPILTVSAIDDFALRGGMVGLLRRGDEWRFVLNPAAARQAGLEFTAGLKRVAAGIVGKEEE